MHFPVYLWLGPLPLHPHWVFETLGYVVAGRFYAWLKERDGDPLEAEDRWWIVAAGFVGAAAGSKLLVLVQHPTLTAEHLLQPLALLDGKSIVGALIGALIAVELTKRRLGITEATGDLFALPLCVGIAIGRVGCFLTGLDDGTYGLPTSLPWAIDFGDGLPRHPTQLYEIAFLLLVLLPALIAAKPKLPRQGDLFKLFMVGYLGFRLALEAIKPGDQMLGLSGIQWACLLTIAWYAVRLRNPAGLFARG